MTDTNPTPSAPVVPETPNPEPVKNEAPEQILGADPAPVEAQAEKPAAGDWPEDWRQKYAQGNEKVMKRLERYASPKAALDALFAAQSKISTGELKSALKPDATPEEVAAWREENGIPASPGEYELNLPNGLIVGEADKPMVDDFLKQAHEANMHPNQVSQALGWYFSKQDEAIAQQAARDEESRMATEDELRAEFGPEYRRNLQIANDLLAGAPGDLKDKFMTGRLADGTAIGNDPDVIRWLVGLSREINPLATVAPGSGTNAAQAVESELTTLRGMMGDRTSEYWKGPNAQRMQERYRQLVSATQKQGARA